MSTIINPYNKSASPDKVIQAWLDRFEAIFPIIFQDVLGDVHPSWRERLLYSMLRGGKRIRVQLVYGLGYAYGIDLRKLDYLAAAIEMIHTYSLVHDDLPAMDDDAFRRGAPCAHKVFDEADAILIGDGLVADAFSLVATAPVWTSQERLDVTVLLAQAAGSQELVYGQWLDLKKHTMSFDDLCRLHLKKTGALFAACFRGVSILANQKNDALTLAQAGAHLGLAFQIQDDVLDLSPLACIGKTAGKDLLQGKKTAVTFLGQEGAEQKSHELYLEAQKCLKSCRSPAQLEILFFILETMISRKR